jgi:chloramphenicol 3-O phosphotransferase
VPGRIVLLNGVSSSGKSTVGRALLDVLPSPWFLMAVDDVGAMRSARATAGLSEDALADVLRRTRAGFHRAVAGMVEAGNDVVVDHVLSEPWRRVDCREVWAPYDVLAVGVHCPSDELLRREAGRDRPRGLALSQLEEVHLGAYDVEVDTSVLSPAECAERIQIRMGTGGWTGLG